MSAFERLEPRELQLPQGPIRYRELGTGEPMVLVHGLLTNSLLWADMACALAKDFRVIAPDWPLGSHERPLDPAADLTRRDWRTSSRRSSSSTSRSSATTPAARCASSWPFTTPRASPGSYSCRATPTRTSPRPSSARSSFSLGSRAPCG